MVGTVRTLASNYGKELTQNKVGDISEQEATEALRVHKGNIWAAVTESVEQRQSKVLPLLYGNVHCISSNRMKKA